MTLFEQTTSERTGGGSRFRSSTGVETGEAQSKRSALNIRFETGPSRKDILHFTNQLAVMIKAGISLQDSLESIAANIKKEKFRAIILDLKTHIEAGESFSQALGEHRDVFSNLYVNMVAAAEISGSLSGMLQQLAGYLDQEAETRSQVIGAMVYPVIILVMAVATTLFLLMFVLPRFLAIFEGKEHLLPAPTKMIMAASTFMRQYWFILLPGVVGLCWLAWFLTRSGAGQHWWHKTKLRIPLLKTLCRSLYITRSMHTMGVLTSAGVPILDTIMITSQISGNVLFESMWKHVHEAVRQGKKIASSLYSYELMPGSVVQMIQSGEESGTLSEVLQDISEFYARELKTVIKMVTSMIEPIMIVLMGVLVGFIAMSVILPIFRMSSLVTS
jgi:type IV pilus assembly protein PilC